MNEREIQFHKYDVQFSPKEIDITFYDEIIWLEQTCQINFIWYKPLSIFNRETNPFQCMYLHSSKKETPRLFNLIF